MLNILVDLPDLMQKEPCQNIQIFSCNIFSATFWVVQHMQKKLVKIIAYSKEKELCKNIQHSSRKKNPKTGVALPRPSGWITMLSNIFKNILDFSLLILKKVYDKYSSVFLL